MTRQQVAPDDLAVPAPRAPMDAPAPDLHRRRTWPRRRRAFAAAAVVLAGLATAAGATAVAGPAPGTPALAQATAAPTTAPLARQGRVAPAPLPPGVYRNYFRSLMDLRVFSSGPWANGRLRPDDEDNDALQKPVVTDNVQIVHDPAADDGRALDVSTRVGSYRTGSGEQRGWTNGRVLLLHHDTAPPVRVQARVRMTASAFTKGAVMWWPAGGGWPWEVDFAETFGGESSSDAWSRRAQVAQRWHADLDGDGRAVEHLSLDHPIDATRYHVYDLTITASRMSVRIDGVEVLSTKDPAFLPRGAGYFAVGKALTGSRDASGRGRDDVLVDWLRIDKLSGAQPRS